MACNIYQILRMCEDFNQRHISLVHQLECQSYSSKLLLSTLSFAESIIILQVNMDKMSRTSGAVSGFCLLYCLTRRQRWYVRRVESDRQGEYMNSCNHSKGQIHIRLQVHGTNTDLTQSPRTYFPFSYIIGNVFSSLYNTVQVP